MESYAIRESKGVFTIPEMLDRSCSDFSSKVALQIWRDDGYYKVTYGELKKYVDSLAAELAGMGIGKGDKVALLGENRPEWAISYLGILRAGATVVPIDSLLKPHEYRYALSDSEVKAIIISGKFISDFMEILSELPSIRDVVSMDDESEGDVRKLSDLLSSSRPAPDVAVELEDLASLIYTSGTTGRPKGVMLTHKNIMSDVSGAYRVIVYDENDNFLSVLPLHHTFECTCGFIVPLYAGSTITYARSLKSRDLIEDMSRARTTIMLGVPLLFEKMYLGLKRGISQKPALTRGIFKTTLGIVKGMEKAFRVKAGGVMFRSLRKKAGMDSMRLMISGGGPLDPQLAAEFWRLGFKLLQGYGLTETSPVVSVNPQEKPKLASVGPPIPGVEIKIVNPDGSGVGEVAVRGDIVMKGYYRNPEATAAVMKDGWLYTGDSGWIDEDGYLYITGRLKDVIVTRAGKNVYPEEIEHELNKSPFILESLVLGAPVSQGFGEEVQAIIVPDYEQLDRYADEHNLKLEEKDIEEIIKKEVAKRCSNLADYKKVKAFRIREEEFPKTSTKKIKRYLFKQEVVEVKGDDKK